MKNRFSLFMKIAFTVLILTLFVIFIPDGVDADAAENTITLNVTEVAITKDSKFKLRVYNVPKNAVVEFASDDISVAVVNKRTGYITALSNGECTVTVTVTAGSVNETLKCNVVVGPAAISIKLTKTELVLCKGMRKVLKTIVSPLNTVERPVFYSTDKNVASVTSVGRVRAKAEGEATIIAFLTNRESAECKVIVLSEEDYEQYVENGTLEGLLDNPPDDNMGSDDNKGTDDEQNNDGESGQEEANEER